MSDTKTRKMPTEAEAWALYESMVEFVVANGLRREEPMSGWWWSTEFGEAHLGEVVEDILHERFKIDTRTKIESEPMEFWGDVQTVEHA